MNTKRTHVLKVDSLVEKDSPKKNMDVEEVFDVPWSLHWDVPRHNSDH